MPRREIELIIGEFYHIYNKAVPNSLLFSQERNYPFFVTKIKKYLLDCTDIIAYCLMPSHYHLLLKIKSAGLPSAMSKLAMSYAKAYNKVYDRTGSLFQGRYQIRQIQELIYLNQVVDYIHFNPVKAGLVEKPAEWKHSSFREYIGDREIDFINPRPYFEQYKNVNVPSVFPLINRYRKEMEDFI